MASARDQMIEAAERIGAEQGLAAMSLRAVQAASGQRNKSAAQYHFGSREGLIEAVVSARMGPINERRLEMLDALDRRGEPPTLRDLVEVLTLPLAEHVLDPAGSCWARFVMQGYVDPELSTAVRRCFEGRSIRDLHHRMAAALDHLPDALRSRRVDQATGLVVSGMAAAESGYGPSRDHALFVANLVDVATAVLAAPASSTTLAALEADEARTA